MLVAINTQAINEFQTPPILIAKIDLAVLRTQLELAKKCREISPNMSEYVTNPEFVSNERFVNQDENILDPYKCEFSILPEDFSGGEEYQDDSGYEEPRVMDLVFYFYGATVSFGLRIDYLYTGRSETNPIDTGQFLKALARWQN